MDTQAAVDTYIEYIQHNLSRSSATAEKYALALQRIDHWLVINGVGLLTATLADLEKITGLVAHREGLAASSRSVMIAAARGFYAWAFRRRLVSVDPAADLVYPRLGKSLPIPISRENASKLLLQPDMETLAGVRDCAMMSVIIGAGLRVSGVASLNESSLLFEKFDGREHLILRVIEKGKKERLVPVPHETRLLVRTYLGHPDLDAIDRRLPNGDRVLWVSLRNRSVPAHEYIGEKRRLTTGGIYDRIKTHGEAAGVPAAQLHPHAGRHLYGTQLTEGDAPTLKVQALMGHEDPKSTEIYTHLAVQSLIKTIDKARPFAGIHTPVTDILREIPDV